MIEVYLQFIMINVYASGIFLPLAVARDYEATDEQWSATCAATRMYAVSRAVVRLGLYLLL